MKPNNWPQFPMFIPWTVVIPTSSCPCARSQPKQIPDPSRRMKKAQESSNPGEKRKASSGCVYTCVYVSNAERVDDILILQLGGWPMRMVSRRKFPWFPHGRTLATWNEAISASPGARRIARSSNFTWTSPLRRCPSVIFRDTAWNLFKLGRKNPLGAQVTFLCPASAYPRTMGNVDEGR